MRTAVYTFICIVKVHISYWFPTLYMHCSWLPCGLSLLVVGLSFVLGLCGAMDGFVLDETQSPIHPFGTKSESCVSK